MKQNELLDIVSKLTLILEVEIAAFCESGLLSWELSEGTKIHLKPREGELWVLDETYGELSITQSYAIDGIASSFNLERIDGYTED